MRYQKRHYVDAAEIFAREMRDPENTDAQRSAVRRIAREFEAMYRQDNPRFDVDRFRSAAGMGI
jgi:hypothetical protein